MSDIQTRTPPIALYAGGERGEWLKARKQGIGGSDIATVLGMSPYASAVNVYLDKTSEAIEAIESPHMKAGTILESAIADWFEEESGIGTTEGGVLYQIADGRPFLSTPDRLLCRLPLTESSDIGILECKNTTINFNAEDSEKFPMHWYAQLQWNLGVTGLRWGALAWLTNGWKFQWLEFEANDEFIQEAQAVALAFWNDHVIPRKIPTGGFIGDTGALFPRHVEGKTVEAAPALLERIFRGKEIAEELKRLKEEEEAIKEEIKNCMEDAEAVVYDGIPLATWKAKAGYDKVDSKLLKTEQPDIWQQYARPTKQAREFRWK